MAKDRVFLLCRTIQSRDLARLFDDNPRIESLFYRLLLGSDDFGRLRGELELVRAECCPFTRRSLRTLEKDLAVLAELGKDPADPDSKGMIYRYEVDGQPYIQITNYDKHQGDQNWTRLKATFPPPPDWVPPESLVRLLVTTGAPAKFSAERYRIVPNTIEAYRASIEPCRDVPDSEPQTRQKIADEIADSAHRTGIEPCRTVSKRVEAYPPSPSPSLSLGDPRAREESPAERLVPKAEADTFFDPPSVPDEAHMLAVNHPEIADTLRAVRPNWRGQKAVKWVGAFAQLLEENPQIAPEVLFGWLREDPPDSGNNPGIWWDRHKTVWQRQQERTGGPVARPGPPPEVLRPDEYATYYPEEVRPCLYAWSDYLGRLDADERTRLRRELSETLQAHGRGEVEASDLPIPPGAEALA